VTIQDMADALYAGPPEAFTAARTAAAKEHPDLARELRALRRPTVAAWLVNALARAEPDLLDELLALGPALGAAQRAGEADDLRTLGAQRRALLRAVTDRAFAIAGRAPTATSRAEVEGTLDAALADPATADAVRSGRLTRALTYAGFGGVDLDGAVAVGAPSRKATPKPDTAAAEAAALEAAGALDDAVRALQRAEGEQQAADQALQAADDVRAGAARRAGSAQQRAGQAAEEVAAAQRRAEQTRSALDRLRRTGHPAES
jgi:hypothetical protein